MNDAGTPLPQVPVFDLGRVDALRDRLTNVAGYAFLEDVMEGDGFQQFVDAVTSELPPGLSRDVVFDSCRSVLGKRLTLARLGTLAWRLAGNIPRLRRGIPVHPWSQQNVDEWVPVQIIGGEYTQTARGDAACNFSFRALAGTPAPMVFRQRLTKRHCAAMAVHMGFSKRRGKKQRPFHDSLQYVNLRCCVLVEIAKSQHRPTFFHMAVPKVFLDWNVDLLKMRYRVGWECPKSYTHPCHKCVIGYKDCPAATHRETHVLAHCHGCQRDDARFDPERSTELCLACYLQERLG